MPRKMGPEERRRRADQRAEWARQRREFEEIYDRHALARRRCAPRAPSADPPSPVKLPRPERLSFDTGPWLEEPDFV